MPPPPPNKCPLYTRRCLKFVFVNKYHYSNQCPYWVSALNPVRTSLWKTPLFQQVLSAPILFQWSQCQIKCELRSTMLHLPSIAHTKFCNKNFVHLLSLLAIMSMWVHSFFQRNEAVSKFFKDCLAGCSGQEGSRDNKRIFFLVFLIPLKWRSKFCLAHYVVVSQKRNKHLLISTLFWISVLPRGNKSKKCHWGTKSNHYDMLHCCWVYLKRITVPVHVY